MSSTESVGCPFVSINSWPFGQLREHNKYVFSRDITRVNKPFMLATIPLHGIGTPVKQW